MAKEWYFLNKEKWKLGLVKTYHTIEEYEKERRIWWELLLLISYTTCLVPKEWYFLTTKTGAKIGFVKTCTTIKKYEEQRLECWLLLAELFPDRIFKAIKHFDGTMFDNSFIVWIETPDGVYSHHVNNKHWDKFNHVKMVENSPEYDGHTIRDTKRLLSLNKIVITKK